MAKAAKAAKAAKGAEAAAMESDLIAGLGRAGVKHNPADIVRIGQDQAGRTVFLETGNSTAGLEHILSGHAADFARAGISAQEIPDLVIAAATRGTVVGMQSTRPIYQVEFGGGIRRVAITIGDNGFIVGANPVG